MAADSKIQYYITLQDALRGIATLDEDAFFILIRALNSIDVIEQSIAKKQTTAQFDTAIKQNQPDNKPIKDTFEKHVFDELKDLIIKQFSKIRFEKDKTLTQEDINKFAINIKGPYKMWALGFLQPHLTLAQLKDINDKIKELEQKGAKQKPAKSEEVKPIEQGEAQSQPAETK